MLNSYQRLQASIQMNNKTEDFMFARIYNNKKYGFFTLMLSISSTIMILFFICSNAIIHSISSKYEETQYLKNYELALINLSEIIENKYADFHTLSGKLLTNNQIDPVLAAFYNADSDANITPLQKKDCFDFLIDLCNDDRYLRGFLLYSFQSNQLSYFSSSMHSSANLDLSIEELGITTFTDKTVATTRVNELLALYSNATDIESDNYNYYGFVATIFNKPTEPLGLLIPLYHTSEFSDALNRYNLYNNYLFTITNDDNQLLFRSNNLLENQDFTKSYTNSYIDQYHNKISYNAAKPAWHMNSFTSSVSLVSMVVAILTLSLLYITFYLSKKNIKYILMGMNGFQLSNLNYRIPALNTNNEFTQIIDEFNKVCGELQRSVELTFLYELQQKRSELYALQTSINPHFLYNTLEMIRNQILQGDQAGSSKMLLLLSRVHRNLTNTKAFVTIENEVEICESLMELYQSRFPNFDYEFIIDDEAAFYALPKNTIQPFIENYFVHGIVPDRNDNFICINISLEILKGKKYIYFYIFNNGKPITQESIDKINEKLDASIYENSESAQGFALANIYKRLKIVFNTDCQMTAGSYQNNIGFQVNIRFPANTIEEIEDYIQ